MKNLLIAIIYCLFSFQVFALEINQNFLSQFEGIAIKTIRQSETTFSNSNKRKSEFNGIRDFKELLGNLDKEGKIRYNTRLIYIDDEKEIENNIKTTWYRYCSNKKNCKTYQYYLYYQKNDIMDKYVVANDMLLLGKVDNQNLVLLIVKQDTKKIRKLLNLLNLSNNNKRISYKQNKNNTNLVNPVIEKTNSIYSDTSNLQEKKDLKIYENKKTNKIVIVGKATKIKDGDTIVISDLFNVRLFGIDTPESKQTCLDKHKNLYNCGIEAKHFLETIIGKKSLTCINNGNEKYGRFLFVCKNDKYNINQIMVKNGWALSYFNGEYKADEEYAKQNKLGIWKGEFERPEIWRKKNKNKGK